MAVSQDVKSDSQSVLDSAGRPQSLFCRGFLSASFLTDGCPQQYDKSCRHACKKSVQCLDGGLHVSIKTGHVNWYMRCQA